MTPTVSADRSTVEPEADDPVDPDESLLYRWLHQVPCSAPCWEGITPGETSAPVALDLLRQHPLVREAEITSLSGGFPPWGYVEWTGTHSDKGHLTFDEASVSQAIEAGDVTFASSFILRDVIQVYGEPSHVAAGASYGPDFGSGIGYGLAFFYLPQGFALVYGGDEIASLQSLITESLVFHGMVFFILTKEGLPPNSSFNPDYLRRTLRPWEGFHEYGYYCAEVDEGGNACAGAGAQP